ncbi:signal peptidase I [Virgibacillus halodenitrificans]|uniref:signal peptidase I SipW n=1 Tax=Virgibacillus halodenitrificans TaxID=1482 RepID=UPI001EED0780|nr:signal peptidase I [Virgibacillus halodenitrificans]MCG1026826.1 signal peptidase I [Virgibacillus halodenitrificans]MCJ0932597.1 signal peptidase I [Virgibacillus halodenitrificans]
MKRRVVMKWVNRLVSTILMVLLITVVGIVLSTKLSGGEPQVFGYQLKTVLSGSMEPGIQTGSIIAVKPTDDGSKFKKDDVITFMADEDIMITHRIAEVIKSENGVMYTTKGDNNNAADSEPVIAENVVASYDGFTIPYVGYIIDFSQSPKGSIVFLILPGILMLGYSAFTIWRALGQLEDKNKSGTAEAK